MQVWEPLEMFVNGANNENVLFYLHNANIPINYMYCKYNTSVHVLCYIPPLYNCKQLIGFLALMSVTADQVFTSISVTDQEI